MYTKPSFSWLEGVPRHLLCSTLRTVFSNVLPGTTFSQSFFDLKENLELNKKRIKIKNLSDDNFNISEAINLQLKNRDVDKPKNLSDMQIKIAKSDLEKLHNFESKEINGFIKDNLN